MRKVAPYFISFMLPPLLMVTVRAGGSWPWLVVAFLFLMIPMLDLVIGEDPEQPPETPRPRFSVYEIPLLLWPPVMTATLLWTFHFLSSHELSGTTWWGTVVALGIINGVVGINVGHELCHRSGRLERVAAEILLTGCSYSHFSVEHVYGHHRHVATPRDPATSRLNESFYAFWVRSVVCSYLSFWRLETGIVERRGVRPFSWKDRRLRYPLVLTLVYAGVWLAFGWTGLMAMLLQSVFAFSLLEIINYIEHYGLLRQEIRPGRFEKVQPRHSWNTCFALTNWFLFNLQRHSDHHYMASRPYDRLRHDTTAPQLPAGYATMVLLALVPPLWFAVMNPRVEAWRARYGPREQA